MAEEAEEMNVKVIFNFLVFKNYCVVNIVVEIFCGKV